LSKAGLAVSNLVPLVQELFTAGIASSTRKVYGTGASRYTKFCEATSLSAYPTSENTLMLFVAHLHSEGLAPGTIKSYLAGVRHDQIGAGLGNLYSSDASTGICTERGKTTGKTKFI